MASEFENSEKIAKLPKEGVHCFPANASQVKTRRIVTVILMVVFLALALLFLKIWSYLFRAYLMSQ